MQPIKEVLKKAPTYNFWPAVHALGMTAQEQNLYQHHLDNINNGRVVKNPDGSQSTLRQLSVTVGKHVFNIPSVWDGRILSDEEAIQRAAEVGWSHWPSYATPEEAEQRYVGQMHPFIEKDIPGTR